MSVGLAPAPDNTGLSWGGLGCWRSGVEGNSRTGAVVLTPLLSAEGLSVIPFVLERRHRRNCSFPRRCGAALIEIQNHGEL